jgi:hypothetical protein
MWLNDQWWVGLIMSEMELADWAGLGIPELWMYSISSCIKVADPLWLLFQHCLVEFAHPAINLASGLKI